MPVRYAGQTLFYRRTLMPRKRERVNMACEKVILSRCQEMRSVKKTQSASECLNIRDTLLGNHRLTLK